MRACELSCVCGGWGCVAGVGVWVWVCVCVGVCGCVRVFYIRNTMLCLITILFLRFYYTFPSIL